VGLLAQRPLARALVAFHAGDDAAVTRGAGLVPLHQAPPYFTHLRGLCELATGRYGAAAATFEECLDEYLNPASAARRTFARGVPLETCYDVRRLGSPELHALLDALRVVSRVAAGENVPTTRLHVVRQQLSEVAPRDLLATAYLKVVELLLPSFGPAPGGSRVSELLRLVDDLRVRQPGLLRELRLVLRALPRSALTGASVAAVLQRVDAGR
jgi:hypothetical protein